MTGDTFITVVIAVLGVASIGLIAWSALVGELVVKPNRRAENEYYVATALYKQGLPTDAELARRRADELSAKADKAHRWLGLGAK